MKLRNYIFEINKNRLKRLLADWQWLVDGDYNVWFMNHFGDLFLQKGKSEAVHLLTLHNGKFQKLADSEMAFADMISDPAKADQILRTKLVDALVEQGMDLPPGHIYMFRHNPQRGAGAAKDVLIHPTEQAFDSLAELHRSKASNH